jgi:hypothetical protein
MTIPGNNLLSMALTLIGRQQFTYKRFQSRTPNSIGEDVTTYYSPQTLSGSVQPVPRELFERYGLQFQSSYINVYVSKGVLDVTRDMSGDQIVFNCITYNVLSTTPWVAIDGWDAVLCIQVS